MELVGGRHDGEVVSPGFSLDLEQVRSAFTRVDAVTWQAHPMGEQDEGPSISVEGEYAGREVWLRVLAFAPDDEVPGETFDLYQPEVTSRAKERPKRWIRSPSPPGGVALGKPPSAYPGDEPISLPIHNATIRLVCADRHSVFPVSGPQVAG